MTIATLDTPSPGHKTERGFFAMMAPGARRAFFYLFVIGVAFAIAFPVLWLLLTSLRPASGMFYVHRGTEFTLENFAEVFENKTVIKAYVNSAIIATLATILSLGITVTSGYMLSRFRGPIASSWFSIIYVFRCVPYISWVLPLYLLTQDLGVYDSYLGLLLPHIAVHICFFSWLMKGFFDGIDPSMEYAALIDGCTRWGAFVRVALPSALPGLAALAVLCWLWTWNEFLFALLLTSHNTPVLTVVMAQFVHELGIEWNLMSATAIMALGPALLITFFGQKYIITGLKI